MSERAATDAHATGLVGALALNVWALFPLIERIANLTLFPNQIIQLYRLATLLLLLMCLRRWSTLGLGLRWMLLPATYVAAFLVVSEYGVSPDSSRLWHLQYLPLSLLNYAGWFLVGACFEPMRVFRTFTRWCLVLAAWAALLIAVGVDDTRYLSSIDVPVGTTFAVSAGQFLLAIVFMLVATASLKKTVLGLALIGAFVAWLGRLESIRFGLPLGTRVDDTLVARRVRERRARTLGAAMAVLVTAGLGATVVAASYVAVPGFAEKIEATVERFGQPDPARQQVDEEQWLLLQEYFPRGTGYKTFAWLTQDRIHYTTRTKGGDVVSGVQLHNSYFHWLLEGGWSVAIVVLLLYLAQAALLGSMALDARSRRVAIALGAVTLCSMIYAAFHQLYDTAYFFGLFGLVVGAHHRARRARLLVGRTAA